MKMVMLETSDCDDPHGQINKLVIDPMVRLPALSLAE
jgi:hypothetical protein